MAEGLARIFAAIVKTDYHVTYIRCTNRTIVQSNKPYFYVNAEAGFYGTDGRIRFQHAEGRDVDKIVSEIERW